VLSSIGNTILSVVLLIALLLFDYIVFNAVPFFSLIATNGALVLVYGIYGPVFIGRLLIELFGLSLDIIKWMVFYPYTSSSCIVLLFVFSWCIWPWCRSKSKYFKTSHDRLYDMDERLEELQISLKIIKTTTKETNASINSIIARLDSIEHLLNKRIN
jgi:hypothetical protein